MVAGYGSWLKGPRKIIARLWTVGLTPPRFQMAVPTCCEFLSVEDDSARVMEVTQRMAEQFEKTEKLLGISIPMSNGKKTSGDGLLGLQSRRLDRARRRLRHSEDDVIIVAKMGTDDETVRNGSDVEETALGNHLSSLRMALIPVTIAIGRVNLGLLVLRSRIVVSATTVCRDLLAELGH